MLLLKIISRYKHVLKSSSQILFVLGYLKVKVAQSCPSLCDPMVYKVHGILQPRTLEWVAFPFSRGSSQPRIEPRSPTLHADSSPAEPQGKPRHTGVGSLPLLQGIFPTQESNQGLLHCRRIFYPLSCQGSPCKLTFIGPSPSSPSIIGGHQSALYKKLDSV